MGISRAFTLQAIEGFDLLSNLGKILCPKNLITTFNEDPMKTLQYKEQTTCGCCLSDSPTPCSACCHNVPSFKGHIKTWKIRSCFNKSYCSCSQYSTVMSIMWVYYWSVHQSEFQIWIIKNKTFLIFPMWLWLPYSTFLYSTFL